MDFINSTTETAICDSMALFFMRVRIRCRHGIPSVQSYVSFVVVVKRYTNSPSALMCPLCDTKKGGIEPRNVVDTLIPYMKLMRRSEWFQHLVTVATEALLDVIRKRTRGVSDVDEWCLPIPRQMCSCKDCKQLIPFLQSSQAQSKIIRAPETLRKHMESKLREAFPLKGSVSYSSHHDYFTFETIKERPTPYGLMITKKALVLQPFAAHSTLASHLMEG
jgi:hypothetical protein